MKIEYPTQGTCAKAILIDVDDTTKTINNVTFIGGCNGNTSGISMLVKGMKVDDVIQRLNGIQCGMKTTSCPDQLAKALKSACQPD
ncbi:MAG: TIGR03905 family TSCPD domain-containing protein [Prevotellaceae bacterium]|nr:TIGR03905 family TSCPD domain-containing protein [Prevotellaceae bacterium]